MPVDEDVETDLHGGNLSEARRVYGEPDNGWIDLSTGISPWAYPIPDVTPSAWQRLPEPADIETLCRAAARAYGLQDHRHIVAAPGTQALLQWLPVLVDADRVAVLSPTYNEHRRVWHGFGRHVVECLNPDDMPDNCGAIVLVNPNNPDGRRIEIDTLAGLAEKMRRRDGVLIVDEAFVDADSEISIAPRAAEFGAIVLRSFGKFYGLAGLRLGFAVAPCALAARLRASIGPWAVSGPAVQIGTVALSDESWRVQHQRRLRESSDRLRQMFKKFNIRILGSTELFVLVEHDDAPSLFENLVRTGIWVRRFSFNPQWLRFGLPGNADQWQRLEAALQSA